MNDRSNNSLAVIEDQDYPTMPHHATSTSALVLDGDSLDRMMKLAAIMASGRSTIPQHLQKNEADCLAVIMQAMQWKMNPFAVSQKTHMVNGVLGYEAQLVNAVITSIAPVEGRINYRWDGPWEKIIGRFKEVTSSTKKDDNGQPKKYRVPAWDLKDEEGLKVTVWATIKGEAEPRALEIYMAQARTRNSTLWADDPKQQLAYLAVKRWARLHCPDVILGVYTPDELEESAPIRDITPRPQRQDPKAIAQSARPEVEHSDERDQLIQDLEDVMLKQGLESLQHVWAEVLTKEQRKLVGGDELERLKTLQSAQAEGAQP